MVIPGKDVTFEVSRAYEYDGTDFTNRLRVANTADYTDGFVAKVIWQDPSDLIVSPTSTPSADAMFGTGNTAKVTVQTNNKSGNALVGIYKSGDTNTPVWSYHIWVTSYTGAATATNNGFVFMKRNLGATADGTSLAARGLFYQWGRKDPFPGAKAGTAGYAARANFYGINEAGFNTAAVKVTGADNHACIIESIQKPTTFFTYYNNSDYNWLRALEDDLWIIRENNNDLKTIYDPCPPGWRVPAHKGESPSANNAPWSGYTGISITGTDNAGLRFASDSEWPAAGHRNEHTGTATQANEIGTYWLAYAANANGGMCDFRASDALVEANVSLYRACGSSVRCVHE
jgi:hypothetical protein